MSRYYYGELREAMIQAIKAYITAPDWEAARGVVDAHREVLLHEEVHNVFWEIIGLNQFDERANEMLRTHEEVLRWCRDEGIEAAFHRAKGLKGEE